MIGNGRIYRVMLPIACLLATGWLTTAALNAQQTIELPGEDRWLDADFEEVFRVGTLTGEEWEQFGNVRTVAFDASGRLHIFDRQGWAAGRIVVVDTEGALVHSVGRKGESGRPAPATSRSVERILLAGSEAVKDTVAVGWLPPVDSVFLGRMPNGFEFKRPRLRTFAPRLHWGVLPDGRVAFSDSTTYTVKIAEAGAGIVRIVTRPVRPEPVTAGVIRGEKRRRLAELEEGAEPGEDLKEDRERIEELKFFTEIPVIR